VRYTIRHFPDVPGIDKAHWSVWRPGRYNAPFRGFHSFARCTDYTSAIQAVENDIFEATSQFPDQPTWMAVIHWTDMQEKSWNFFDARVVNGVLPLPLTALQ